MSRSWVKHRLKAGRLFSSLLILGALTLAGLEVWGGQPPLPAHDWLYQNLSKISQARLTPLTFAVLGDSRNSRTTFPRLLGQINRDPDLAFVIHLGDMVEDGELEQYRAFLQQVRQNLTIPLLTAPGNHDLENNGRCFYYEIFGPYYYSFQLDNHYFIILDDARGAGLDKWQFHWLEEELKKAQSFAQRLVFMHIPPLKPQGSRYHSLPLEGGLRLVELFKKYNVTRVFTGHIHGYYTGAWSGVPYTITGGGGAPLSGTDPEHYFFHYLKVSLRGDRLHIKVERVFAD